MSRNSAHSPFLGFSKELRFGLTPRGDLIAVGEARRGSACDCICPACRTPLIARKGQRLIHHFAHAGGSRNGCGFGQETNAHIWAKKVLETELLLLLPGIKASIGNRSKTVTPGGDYRFVKASLEARHGSIVPDVILTAPNGRRLIVEIRVTHASRSKKLEKIRHLDVSAIEIDLSPWRTCDDEAVVRNALLHEADRHWLFNPAMDDAMESLRADLAAEAARFAAAKLLKAENAMQSIRNRPSGHSDLHKHMHTICLELGLGIVTHGDEVDDGFAMASKHWKSAALHRLFSSEDSRITRERLLHAVQDCLIPEFKRSAVALFPMRELLLSHPDFVPLNATIDGFIEDLIENDIAYYRKGDNWIIDHWPVRLRELERSHLQQREERQREGERLSELYGIIQRIQELCGDSIPNFWISNLQVGMTRTPTEIARGGGQEWLLLKARLGAICEMLKGGAIAYDLVGLPLQAALEHALHIEAIEVARRAAEEEAARAAASQARSETLKSHAFKLLGNEASAWLEMESNGHIRLGYAAESDGGLSEALIALDQYYVTKTTIERAKAKLEVLHSNLKKAASKLWDEQRASLFVSTSRSDLRGMSPLKYCQDERTFEVCMSLLKESLKKKR